MPDFLKYVVLSTNVYGIPIFCWWKYHKLLLHVLLGTHFNLFYIYEQGFGSGSAFILLAGSESGFRRAKMTHKIAENRKKLRNFMSWSAGCSLFRAEGFSCSLGVLYRGLGKSRLQFLRKKYEFFSCKLCSNFDHQNPGSGSAIRKKGGSRSGSALNQCGFETLYMKSIHRCFCVMLNL